MEQLEKAILEDEIELNEQNEQIMDSMNASSKITVEQQKAKSMLEQNKIRKAELNQKILANKTQYSSAEEEMKREEELLKAAKKELDSAYVAKKELLRNADIKRQDILSLQKKQQEKQKNYHIIDSKLETVKNMAERYEGYSQSIRRVMEQKKPVYGMRGNAELVHSVDSSAKAIDLTNKNVELNFPGDTRHAAFAEDAFKYLDRMGDQYDLIVLDPPAFAKHRDALRNALQGYRKLNVKAFEKIKPGGILFTFSCSQAVSKENFRTAVFTAAAMSGRSVRILHQLTQPADHPVSIYHPEGEYLKGLVLYVE